MVDRARGIVTCALCGDIVTDQQFELDPLFARGERTLGGRGGGLRSLGAPRPIRGTILSMPLSSRPSVEAARRGMVSIARQLEISHDLTEVAVGIYKLAVSVNAITGARTAVLCACLYAVCRRECTSHMVYDFADATKESPYDILAYMKHICQVTHTPVPPLDPSYMVERFAEQLDLGELLRPVVICALKVLRAMHDDWISYGRRPMGVCAAGLLVACHIFGIPRTPEDICGMVRLSADTILRRLDEYSMTPAANLDNIDAYTIGGDTVPPALTHSRMREESRRMDDQVRCLAATYYELVAEAKMSEAATEARCAKWRDFLLRHCEINQVEAREEDLDLLRLSPKEQLVILGLPNTQPIDPQMVAGRVKAETIKLSVKREGSGVLGRPDYQSVAPTRRANQAGGNSSSASHGMDDFSHSVSGVVGSLTGTMVLGGRADDDSFAFSLGGNSHERPMKWESPMQGSHATQLTEWWGESSASSTAAAPPYAASPPLSQSLNAAQVGDCDAAKAVTDSQMVDLYRSYVQNNAEVRGMFDDFDYKSTTDAVPPAEGVGGVATAVTASDAYDGICLDEKAIQSALYDADRPYALPWEIIVLQDLDRDDTKDIDAYIIYDNEARIRREKIGEAMYKEDWIRGKARTPEEIAQLEMNRMTKRRRREPIVEQASVRDAMAKALKGKGAGTINVSQIGQLIPGLMSDGDDPMADEDFHHTDGIGGDDGGDWQIE